MPVEFPWYRWHQPGHRGHPAPRRHPRSGVHPPPGPGARGPRLGPDPVRHHSGSADPAQVAAYVAGHTERINLVVAHRPNISAPTYFAKTLATLDHVSGGRTEVHFITGGSTADQAAEGDHLDKDTRYQRTAEYIRIVKQTWTATEPFDFAGSHYDIRGYQPDLRPVQRPRPRVSFGGSSPPPTGSAHPPIGVDHGEHAPIAPR